MGVQRDEVGEVNRDKIMKKCLRSKIKEFVLYFEGTL